jgi:putative esterase
MADGALTISSQVVAGGNPGQSGDIRTAETYTSDQYSQVQVTSTQLTGSQWIGAVVRSQNTGLSLYLGLYYWNSGSPLLMLYKRTSGSFTQLGTSHPVSALAAGTTLKLTATGSTISFLLNGSAVITVTDTSVTGGAPGIMAYGTGRADNWSGGNIASGGGTSYTIGGTVSGLSGTVVLNDNGGDALSLTANGTFTFATPVPSGSPYNVTVGSVSAGQTCAVTNGSGTVGSANVTNVAVTCTASSGGSGLQMQYVSTDSSGVQTYQATSPDNGPGSQYVRILQPSNPAPGVAHNFLYVLPVEAGEGITFGDGLQVVQSLGLQNQYNLTVIEPSFSIDPWYADNPLNSNLQEDTFMANDLQPWVKANLSTSGSEQHWLLGFSKSGIGGQDLILRHPDKFTLAASWDFPADMSAYDEFGTNSSASYGTDANFQANYRLTATFVAAHTAPFQANNRIWIGGYANYQQDMADYDAVLTAQGIQHTTETPTAMTHNWTSGWVPIALAALHADSVNMH